jgi:peptide/nickel transport system substrate-binding protein
MIHWPRPLVFLSLLLSSFFIVSCQRQPQTNAPPQQQTGLSRERTVGTRGGSLTYRVSSPPKTFNYLMAAEESSLIVSFFLMGGRLVEFDHDKQSYAGGVAEVWKLGDDGRTVELTLREGVKFSDGRPVTADDVAFTFRALYDERTASPIFRDAMTISGRQIEVAVQDARRLRLVFPELVPLPESYLSNVAVLPRHALEEDFKKGTLRDAYNLTSDPTRIISAGAFTVEASQPGERVTLKRNPNYWKKDQAGTQLPYLDTLVIEVVTEANAALTRLNQGGLDIIDRLRPNDYASLRSQQAAVRAYDLGPGLNTDHMWFNLVPGEQNGKPVVNPVKLAWFNDARFRRAVAHAVDRESIATSIVQGLGTPLYGFVSPGNRGWVATDLPRTEHNLDKARALLTEAGFQVRGSQSAPDLFDAKGNPVEFTLIVPQENEPRVKMAAVIQEDLAKLGIKMQVAPVEFQALMTRSQQSYDYEAILLGTVVTEPDASSYYGYLKSNGAGHPWYPKQTSPATPWEARIDELLATMARERDTERRKAIFRDIQLILSEQMPVIPILARHITVASNTRIGNYRPSTIAPYSVWNAEELFIRK